MSLKDSNPVNANKPKRVAIVVADPAVSSGTRDKHVTPWRIENELKKLGANYIQAGLWRGFATRDGNLITGQQNFSGTETAEAVAAALGE
jgi:putative intracellular protease/amidase